MQMFQVQIWPQDGKQNNADPPGKTKQCRSRWKDKTMQIPLERQIHFVCFPCALNELYLDFTFIYLLSLGSSFETTLVFALLWIFSFYFSLNLSIIIFSVEPLYWLRRKRDWLNFHENHLTHSVLKLEGMNMFPCKTIHMVYATTTSN